MYSINMEKKSLATKTNVIDTLPGSWATERKYNTHASVHIPILAGIFHFKGIN